MSARVLHHVNGRLSLRPPQAESLSRLSLALEAAPEILAPTHDEVMEARKVTDLMRFKHK